MEFNVFIDDLFDLLIPEECSDSTKRKSVLSILNDYEDGSWRFDLFQNFIWDNIKETALSYRERQALIQRGESSVLVEAAKKLRLVDGDKGEGSEIAEILLYGIMKKHYKALPVVPKIFYKQNTQDNAKGADSVHIVIESEDDFSLWLGESKFYNSIENARLDSIVESVKGSLDLSKLKKENSIITNVADLDQLDGLTEAMRTNIRKLLDQNESIDRLKPRLHIPILLLHECQITRGHTESSKEYLDKIREYHLDRTRAYFRKQIDKCSAIHLYAEINFHLFLFPVFDKKQIVDKFVATASIFRS